MPILQPYQASWWPYLQRVRRLSTSRTPLCSSLYRHKPCAMCVIAVIPPARAVATVMRRTNAAIGYRQWLCQTRPASLVPAGAKEVRVWEETAGSLDQINYWIAIRLIIGMPLIIGMSLEQLLDCHQINYWNVIRAIIGLPLDKLLECHQ